METNILTNEQKNKEMTRTIDMVLNITTKVVAQLKSEKKATGDYSKSITLEENGYTVTFEAEKYHGGYPPISVNLIFLVNIVRNGVPFAVCQVSPINNKYGSILRENYSKKFRMWIIACDISHIVPIIKSGDTICIDNKGKSAFAKVEILSEEWSYRYHNLLPCDLSRKVRLTKKLGHSEVLAYETDNPPRVATYVADDSTEEYFGDKETIEQKLVTRLRKEEKQSDGLYWYEYTKEDVSADWEESLQLSTPVTEEEMTIMLKKQALKHLLEDCRGEFCYGDKRVEKYMNRYMILGEDLINKVYDEYLTWLKTNCDTFSQDSPSGEFTGIAIDYNDNEDLANDIIKKLFP
jgi:hypothetical protein